MQGTGDMVYENPVAMFPPDRPGNRYEPVESLNHPATSRGIKTPTNKQASRSGDNGNHGQSTGRTEVSGSLPMKIAVVGLVLVLVTFCTMVGLYFQQQSEWRKAFDSQRQEFTSDLDDSNRKYQKLENQSKEIREVKDKIIKLISADNQTSIKLKQLVESDKEIEKKVVDAANESADADIKASATLWDAIAKITNWKLSGDRNVLYKCFSETKTDYKSADAACKGLGGRLAAKALRDPAAVAYILQSTCRDEAWIGYFQNGYEWHWADGGATNNSTTTWQSGEPNGSDPDNCGESARSRDGKIALNDHHCSASDRGRICEIDL